MEKYFKEGDEIWHVPGWSGDGLIVVKCKILKIEDWAKKKDEEYGAVYYNLDEPLPCVSYDELYEKLDDAKNELISRFKEIRDYGEEIQMNVDLNTFRKDTLEFLTTNSKDAPENINHVEKELSRYPEKIRGVDWFNLNDLGITQCWAN